MSDSVITTAIQRPREHSWNICISLDFDHYITITPYRSFQQPLYASSSQIERWFLTRISTWPFGQLKENIHWNKDKTIWVDDRKALEPIRSQYARSSLRFTSYYSRGRQRLNMMSHPKSALALAIRGIWRVLLKLEDNLQCNNARWIIFLSRADDCLDSRTLHWINDKQRSRFEG